MNCDLFKLDNGVRVAVSPMKSSESTTLTIWVKTGSRNEEKRVNGISHFLEHMVFKGSKKRPTAKMISEVVDSLGAEFNAGTHKEWTNFYIKSRNENLPTAFDVLSDMVINPILDPNEIEREKGTIVQEIAMYEDTPMIKIGDVFEEGIYRGNSLGWDIAGDEKSVRSIKKEDFDEYRNKYYFPKNIIVSIAGGITSEKGLELAKKYFGDIAKKDKVTLDAKEIFNSNQNKPQVTLKNKKSDQAHFIFGYLADGRNYKNRFAQSVLSTILGGGMSSRLFIEVRERKGLAYSVRTSMDRYQDTGYIGTYVGTDPVKAEEAIKITLDEHLKLSSKSKEITPKELSKAKEFIKGHIALSLEDTSVVGDFFAQQVLFSDEILTPDDVFSRVDNVTIEDVYFEAERLFKPERLSLGIIGPFENEEKFRSVIS